MANGQFFSGLVRLYHATFDRESDIPGIGYWARQLAKGEIVFAEVAAALNNRGQTPIKALSWLDAPLFQKRNNNRQQ